MNDNQDRVRVDLLKFRRKAFLSYPEDSAERKTFLKTILQNELRLAEQDMPQEFFTFIAEGNKAVLKSTLKHVGVAFSVFLGSVAMFIILHPILHIWSYFYLLGGIVCLYMCGDIIHNYWTYHKNLKVVKQYSNDMHKHIVTISNNLKRLDGPK